MIQSAHDGGVSPQDRHKEVPDVVKKMASFIRSRWDDIQQQLDTLPSKAHLTPASRSTIVEYLLVDMATLEKCLNQLQALCGQHDPLIPEHLKDLYFCSADARREVLEYLKKSRAYLDRFKKAPSTADPVPQKKATITKTSSSSNSNSSGTPSSGSSSSNSPNTSATQKPQAQTAQQGGSWMPWLIGAGALLLLSGAFAKKGRK